MSEENVEIVRRIYEHWKRDHFAFADLLDPQIEYARIGAQGGGVEGQWRGLDEMWAALVEYVRAFSDYRMEAERIVDLGDDRVLAFSRHTAQGKASGAPIEHDGGTCGRCTTARSSGVTPTGTAPPPSKPPGSRSR